MKEFMFTLFMHYSIVSLIFFLLDIISASIKGYPFLQTILMLLVVLVFKEIPLRFYLIPLLLLGLESFIFYTRFGLTFIYVMPLLLCLCWVEKKTSSTPLEIVFFSFISLITHYAFFTVFVLKHKPFDLCTFWQIGANLLVTYFSLKWLPTVERGNRF